jgi:S-DNA-T family DNA segregation ATPase FtsK/SpoIIIE
MGSPRRRQVSEFPLVEDDSPPAPTVGVRRAREAMASAPIVRELDPGAPPRDDPRPIRRGRDASANAAVDAPSTEPYARGRELGALLYVAAATFLTLAIASYDERGGADWVGPVGARVASIFVSAVGLAAWAVPVELALFAIPYLRRRASVTTPARLAGDVVLLATSAALIHVGAAGRTIFGGHLAGGVVGELFGELLRSLFSTVGTFLVGLTTIALVLIARATFSFIAFANRAGATSAAAATKAAASVKGVAEAWQQAKELDRGETAPSLVSSMSGGPAGHDPESGGRITLTGDRPSIDDQSGVRAVSELRMRDDGVISPETHLIARQLAGVDLGADAVPGGPAEMPKSPPREPSVSSMAQLSQPSAPAREEIAPPIILGPAADEPAEDAKPKRRRPGREKEPTIAPPSPDAAMQRAEHAEEAPADEPASDETNADALVLADSETSLVAEEAEEVAEVEAPKPKRKKQTTRMAARGYQLPSNELLSSPPPELAPIDRAALIEDAKALVATLATYKVVGEVREIHPGPVVTTFELEPRIGTKVREVEGLANDLRLSLAKESVRIVAPIPGKNRIGFELPNVQRIPVNFRELVEDRRFGEVKGALPVVLGRDIVGAPFYADLAAMPHLLVAGATGAGKSVGLNVMLTSLLYRRTPEDLRMIMIDPKVVELAPFDRIPHMLLPVVTDMKQALNALKWCVDEMERRYQLLAQAGVKNITTYNGWRDKVIAGTVPNPCPKTITATDHNGLPEDIVLHENKAGKDVDPSLLAQAEQQYPEKLPYIVVVVDEFADLMMSVGKGEVEPPIARLAQKARAAGIHVILATQRPSVDVITGMIKANFPTRIAFRVAQRVDSRTILDAQGAEYLLGKGDMLVSLNGGNGLKRIQCPFVSEEEVDKVCDFLRAQGEPVFDESILAPRPEDMENDEEDEALNPKDQELYDRCVEIVREARKCSTSWLQRKMGLGYNKAARFVDRMERTGVVGPPQGAGKDREVM